MNPPDIGDIQRAARHPLAAGVAGALIGRTLGVGLGSLTAKVTKR